MPIYPLLHAFDPELISTLGTVFEDILRELKLTDRTDPLTTIIAHKVITVAQTGGTIRNGFGSGSCNLCALRRD